VKNAPIAFAATADAFAAFCFADDFDVVRGSPRAAAGL
jgi:hypothetical protein